MNNVQKLLHSPEIQAELHIKSTHIKLDMDKKRQLGNAYLKLYFGLSCMNWTHKKNLGTAWQTAFTQVQNILNGRDENNPATQFLRIVHEQHKKTWPRHIMTHPQRDAAFDGDPAKMRESAIRGIRSAMGEITLASAQAKLVMDQTQAKTQPRQPVRVAAQSAQQRPAPSVDTQQKMAVPLTKSGEPIAAQRGLNSVYAPQQKAASNSKHIAVHPAETERSISHEQNAEKMRHAAGRVIDLAQIMKMMQYNQKTA